MTQATNTVAPRGGAHVRNCVGCCPKCGTCRTWLGHSTAYCELLVSQRADRARFLSSETA